MISCQQYDYIEIACLYHLNIKLTLDNGDIIHGIALTTSSKNKHEYVTLKHQDKELFVQLNRILSMQALVDNPYFKTILFKHHE